MDKSKFAEHMRQARAFEKQVVKLGAAPAGALEVSFKTLPSEEEVRAYLDSKWRIAVKEIRGLQKTIKSRDKDGNDGKTKNERIGKGHFGEVLRGDWKSEPVVIKMSRILDDLRRLRESRADLENEAFILGYIGPHPNIVDLRGIINEDDPPFLGIVLAFCDNGALKNYFKEHPCTLVQKVRILHGIACGIAHLHREGIEHRDLWPANILLDKNLVPKVADYGLAITMYTKNISNKCQFRWSSPERCLNHIVKKPAWNPKNDVWSFAMMAYWALTDCRPYEEIEKGNVLVKDYIMKGLKPEFHAKFGVPPLLAEIVDSCWAFRGLHRPRMREIADRLLIWLQENADPEKDADVFRMNLLAAQYPDEHQTSGFLTPRSTGTEDMSLPRGRPKKPGHESGAG